MSKKGIIILLIIIIGIIGFIVFSYDKSNYVSREGESVSTFVEGDFTLTITNSSDYILAPGVLVTHDSNFTMDFLGEKSPSEYEPLAEIGNVSEVAALLTPEGNNHIHTLIETPVIQPGKYVTYSLANRKPDTHVSFMAMVVETNDGVVFFEKSFDDVTEEEIQFDGQVFDMGTEQNSPLRSGFEGGQPDESRGAENIENGVPEDEAVSIHNQFKDEPPILTLTLAKEYLGFN